MNTLISSRHWSLKERAQSLRSEGRSYREIVKEIGVSKGSVSLWCRNVPLTLAQRNVLQNRRGDQMKGIRVIQTNHWNRRCAEFEKGRALMKKQYQDPQFVAGVMLYWAEGSKNRSVCLTNSDENIVLIMILWFRKYFQVPLENFTLHLQLHTGQNESGEQCYWSRLTGIPRVNFGKTFFKPEGSGYKKNILYHGTAQLRLKSERSTYKLYEILGCIAEYQNMVLNRPPRTEDWLDVLPYATGE